MTAGCAASRRVLARTPVAPLPASSPKRPTSINGRTSAPPEMYLPEACSFQFPKVCSFRLPLTALPAARRPLAHAGRRRGRRQRLPGHPFLPQSPNLRVCDQPVLRGKQAVSHAPRAVHEPADLSFPRPAKIIVVDQCAARRRHSSAGANPARQLLLQPVTVGADDGGNDIV